MHSLEVNHVEKIFEQTQSDVNYQKKIIELMRKPEGSEISGKELSLSIKGANKVFSKVIRVEGGIQFKLKFGIAAAMKFSATKIKDNSIAYIKTNFTIHDNKGKYNIVEIKSPRNTFKGDPFYIYVKNNNYTLPNDFDNKKNYNWYLIK